MNIIIALELLEKMKSEVSHYTCEDVWYNCPSDPEEGHNSGDYKEGIEVQACYCDYNEKIKEIQNIIDLLIGE